MTLSLQALFGSSASQSATTFTISKADLPLLVASSSNDAESLVVAILLIVLEIFEGQLTTETGLTLTDENNVPITYSQGDIANTFYMFYWRILPLSKVNSNFLVFQFVFQEFTTL